MSALAVPAKNANITAITPTRSIILFLFFDIIPLIGTPPNLGLQLLCSGLRSKLPAGRPLTPCGIGPIINPSWKNAIQDYRMKL